MHKTLLEQLQQAQRLLERGNLNACIKTCQELIRKFDSVPQADYLNGLAHKQLESYQTAIDCFHKAEKDPRLIGYALYERAVCLNRLGQREAALECYRQLLQRQPGHEHALANSASIHEQLNQLEPAAQLAEAALAANPNNVVANLTKAAIYRRQSDPKTALKVLNHLESLQLSVVNRALVENQRGRCHQAVKNYSAAFTGFSNANRHLAEQHPFGRPDERGDYSLSTIKRVQAQCMKFSPAALTRDLPKPIFIVGFPRSGTTLLEQILNAHSELCVLDEKETLAPLRERVLPLIGQADQVAQQDLAAQLYAQEIQQYVNTGTPTRAVDKLPLNLIYLGLIHYCFPQAKVIFCLRDPRDACLSCFQQNFALVGAMPYFLDLDNTVRYYQQAMAAAWSYLERFPIDYHVIKYESVVGDLQQSITECLQFLGLEWQDKMHDYRTGAKQRSISTPSYQQVVKPLYRSSVGRWRCYADYVYPAFAGLQHWVEKFDYQE